jgi:redox-sensing transcriptional repressor
MISKPIPDIIVSRLPRYLRVLEQLQAENKQTTSSQEMGARLGITAAQIRKDLSQFGEFGKQGTGYAIPYLVAQLQSILHIDRIWNMALVGAGNLGRAIIHYRGFASAGFMISMVFDSDPNIIGTHIGDYHIENITSLPERLKSSGIRIILLTVPAAEAQEIVDKSVKVGVKAVLNYTPVNLVVPTGVHIQNIDPIIHLQRMTFYLE